MNPVANPYAPGAGAPPPELTGRDELRETLRIATARVRRAGGQPDQLAFIHRAGVERADGGPARGPPRSASLRGTARAGC